jgi:hypothetical protein
MCKYVNVKYLSNFLRGVPQQGVTGHDASIVYQDSDVANFFLNPVSQQQDSVSIGHITSVTYHSAAIDNNKGLGSGSF